MTTEDRERYEDDYGYTRGRCPYCHRTVWSDTSVFECSRGEGTRRSCCDAKTQQTELKGLL